MSYRGIELPNQLAQYGQVQQIQAAQNQNRMADLQMQEYERARTEEEGVRNYLSGADLADPTVRAGLARFGKTGLGYSKALAEQETAGLTRQKTQLEVDAKKFENQNKRLDFIWNGVGAAATPQDAINYITQGVKDGNLSMVQGSAEVKRLQSISEDGFRKYKIEKVLGVLDAKEKLAQFAQTTKDTDLGGVIQRQIYDAQGMPIGAPQQLRKTPTISDMTAQGNLALAQSQEAWKRANPGYEIIQTETGSVGVNKNNPRDVVPISLDGQAVGIKPPPAKLIEVDTQLSALAGSLKAFKDEVAKRKITGAKGLFTGEDTANMTAKYTALLMGVKDLYTLGALTGPDMGIIENQIQNPATWAGSMTSKKAFDAQIQTIEDMLRRNHINTETAFGRPLKATAKAISGLGPDASAGVITNPQFPGFSVGRR
jgi:hypothetical protein